MNTMTTYSIYYKRELTDPLADLDVDNRERVVDKII